MYKLRHQLWDAVYARHINRRWCLLSKKRQANQIVKERRRRNRKKRECVEMMTMSAWATAHAWTSVAQNRCLFFFWFVQSTTCLFLEKAIDAFFPHRFSITHVVALSPSTWDWPMAFKDAIGNHALSFTRKVLSAASFRLLRYYPPYSPTTYVLADLKEKQ